MDEFDKLLKIIEINLKFNEKYKKQYLEPLAYNRVCEQLSVLRKKKILDIYEHHKISKLYKIFYINFFEIKRLNDKEPRIIAQKFLSKKKIRNFIFKRDGFKCLKCGCKTKLQLDHINPISKGGENKISNLQTLCGSCNSKKRDNFKDYRNG